jgi:GntR family transcriptional regulator, transcriptional repressor for pyruvate dehydrogenase complex
VSLPVAARREVRRGVGELFAPVRTRRTFENVIEQIVDSIRSGGLREGDLLPPERELAAKLEVSRPTVREAIKALADAGVVEVRPGPRGGTTVISMWIPDGLVRERVELRADEIFEVLEARRALEPRIAQLAAVRATDVHFEAMHESIELQWRHQADSRKVIQTDLLFHHLMWQAAGNPTLEGLLKSLYRRLEVARDMAVRTEIDSRAAIEINERTLTALMRDDEDEVERVMDEHMSYLERICEDALGRKRIRLLPSFLRGAFAEPRPEETNRQL